MVGGERSQGTLVEMGVLPGGLAPKNRAGVSGPSPPAGGQGAGLPSFPEEAKGVRHVIPAPSDHEVGVPLDQWVLGVPLDHEVGVPPDRGEVDLAILDDPSDF